MYLHAPIFELLTRVIIPQNIGKVNFEFMNSQPARDGQINMLAKFCGNYNVKWAEVANPCFLLFHDLFGVVISVIVLVHDPKKWPRVRNLREFSCLWGRK